MPTFTDEEPKGQTQEEAGIRSRIFSMETFTDLEENVRQCIARIKSSPFIPNEESIRGFAYEVETSQLATFPESRRRKQTLCRALRESEA